MQCMLRQQCLLLCPPETRQGPKHCVGLAHRDMEESRKECEGLKMQVMPPASKLVYAFLPDPCGGGGQLKASTSPCPVPASSTLPLPASTRGPDALGGHGISPCTDPPTMCCSRPLAVRAARASPHPSSGSDKSPACMAYQAYKT